MRTHTLLTRTTALIVAALTTLTLHAFETILWDSSVTDGYYTDPANWIGGVVPSNGNYGKIANMGTLTLRAPAAGMVENSTTLISDIPTTSEIIFNSVGTTWLKAGCDAWPNDWTGFMIRYSDSSHFFNLEGLAKTSANNYPIIEMTDAIFRIQRHPTGFTNVLEQGTLNLYDPGGVVRVGHALVTGSRGEGHWSDGGCIVFKSASTLRAGWIRMRGHPSFHHYMIFEGGSHEVYNGFEIGEGGNTGSRCYLEVHNGLLDVKGGNFHLSNKKPIKAYATLSNSATLQVNNHLYAANPDGAQDMKGAVADITLTDNASLSVGKSMQYLIGENATGTISLSDNSSLSVGQYILIAEAPGTSGTLLLNDNATLSTPAILGGADGTSELKANGGTIIMNATPDNNILMQDLSLVEIGDNGLTIDTAGYSAAINQTLSPATGVNPKLTKTGLGTLTLNNNALDQISITRGILKASDTSASLADSITVANLAGLSTQGATTTLSVDNLTLGDSNGACFIYLDSGDIINVNNTLTLNSCRIGLNTPATDGTYSLLRFNGILPPNTLDAFSFANPAPGKGYTFSIIQDNGDDIIQVEIDSYTVSDALWNGSANTSWHNTDNWTPDTVPNYGTHATFDDSSATKTVDLDSRGVASFITFDSTDSYTLQGTGALDLPATELKNELGSHEIKLPVDISGTLSLPGYASATTTISGPVSADVASLIDKSGSDSLILSGDNTNFLGKWQINGGRIDFTTASSLGSYIDSDAITLANGTLRYSGAPTTTSKGIIINTAEAYQPVLLDIVNDLEHTSAINLTQGVIVKTGAGALTMHIGNGTYMLSRNDASTGTNKYPKDPITIPPSGDNIPVTGLGGINVLEGTLRLKGNGPTLTTISQLHFGVVGGYWDAATSPVLEIDNARFNQGGRSSGKHFILGNQVKIDCPGNAPTLRLVNNAYFDADTIRMGEDCTVDVYPVVFMQNSYCDLSHNISVGRNLSNIYPTLQITDNSTMTLGGSGAIALYRNVDVLVTGNSTLAQTNPRSGFHYEDGQSSGNVLIEDGSTLKTTYILGKNTSTPTGLNLTFDNATLEFLHSTNSISTAYDKQSVTIANGGLTVKCGAGISHAVQFPLRGTGNLTKTGSGELVFDIGLDRRSSSTIELSGIPTGSYSGTTLVAEGTLSVSNETIRSEAVVRVAANATLNLSNGNVTLGKVSGNGTIANGTLTAPYYCQLDDNGNDTLTLDNLTLPNGGMAVYFDTPAEFEPASKSKLAVATLSGGTTVNLANWKAYNLGDKQTARFTQEGNTIYATVIYTYGALIIVR